MPSPATNIPKLHRRQALIGGLALVGLSGISPLARASTLAPAGGVLDFEVHRKGQLLGHHRLTFERKGDNLAVDAQVDFLVKLGPFSLFHYSHQAHETWLGGRFDRLQTSTITNGKKQSVTARRAEGGVMIEPADGQPYSAAAGTLPLTHWNREAMSAPLFNPQDGKLMRERATSRGPEMIQLADGRSINATRYALTGETQIDDWYDEDGLWAALQGKVKDGSTLIYRRL